MPAPIRTLFQLRLRFQFAQEVLAGLAENKGNRPIEIIAASGESPLSFENIKALAPDIIIGDSHYRQTRETAEHLGIPLVDLTGTTHDLAEFSIYPDDKAIGRLAAEHLRQTGLEHFSFVGFSDQAYSDLRRQGYATALNAADLPSYSSPLYADLIGDAEAALVRFIKHLPRPCGIFTCSDLRALSVVQAVRTLGKRIPEDFAIVGVDCDRTLGALVGLGLTSVDHGAWYMGWRAGEMARELVDKGKPKGEAHVIISPSHIEASESTSLRFDNDAVVETFLTTAREHIDKPNALELTLATIPNSRRVVEERMVKRTGKSPLQLIHRLRLEKAIELLKTNRYSIREVAASVGFEYQGDFSRFIKRQTGSSPSVLKRRLIRIG